MYKLSETTDGLQEKICEYFAQAYSSKATIFHAKYCEIIVFQDSPHASANLPNVDPQLEVNVK